ncbi:hypothetical protein AALP_AA8G424100 [Arabis alpina]|uniref:HSF-type DNA-binding domain-containing protein n=1 Tax=Arabis alpina TaxID=50452 RepID=A0A087GCZ8_ARAAL|nr:hypothetical protein AALP_AA8G424100 [Arabis alpina]
MDRKENRNRFFPIVLYEMVDDPSTNSIVSWSESGNSFIVWKESEFCKVVVPSVFQRKEEDLFSFTIRLYNYGFTKVESSDELYEYTNDCFVRGKPDLTRPKSFVFKTAPEMQRVMDRHKEMVLARCLLGHEILANYLLSIWDRGSVRLQTGHKVSDMEEETGKEALQIDILRLGSAPMRPAF